MPTANNPQRVLIVRLGAMGDVLHGLPVAAALRCALPGTGVDWLIEERWAEMLCAPDAFRAGPVNEERPLVERVHTVNTRKWRKNLTATETRLAFANVIRDLRDANYDAVLDVQGAWKSAILARMACGKRVLGFAAPRERGAEWLYSKRVPTNARHVVEMNLALAEALTSLSVQEPSFALPRHAASESWVAQELASRKVREFALLTPGAGWAAKQWPAERFGELARQLSAQGIAPLINFGPGEQELASQVIAASGGTAQAISCGLSQLIALTRRARLFVGGDTGPTHLAAALNVPVVALFGPTDPARNGPYSSRVSVLRNPGSTTSYQHVSTADPGLLSITAEEVWSAARRLMEI
ncbi:MAG TPA: lipopolysaccharide heptosyltransferase I [Candidatus Acidoferrales bacterium]|nr:lipopolysaccharide heptosyltransferase I [Candidatus Acidoferrales bacterium]